MNRFHILQFGLTLIGILGIGLILTFVMAALSSSSAVPAVVYLESGRVGDGSSAATPCGTLAKAMRTLDGRGGKIVVCGDFTLSVNTLLPEQAGDLIFTSAGNGRLILAARLTLAKNTNANTVYFDLPVQANGQEIIGNFNSVHFTEAFTVDGTLDFYGGADADSAAGNADCVTELPYAVTVDNGRFGLFTAGNRRTSSSTCIGSIAAPVSLTVNGGVFGTEGDYADATAYNKTFDAFSISGAAILADDAVLTVRGGTFYTPIYAVGRRGMMTAGASVSSALTASDAKYYAIDGDVTVNLIGGSFLGGAVSAYYIDAGFTQLMRGNYTLTVSEDAVFAAGTVFDALQVKTYAGESAAASLVCPSALEASARGFDIVNGIATGETDPLRVVFVGDSITEGYPWNRTTESYPAAFLQIAVEAGRDVIVSNFGVSGTGMLPSAVRYYPDMLAYPLVLHETDADIYIFGLGTNDSKVGVTNGAEQKYRDDYSAFIRTVGDLPSTKKVYINSSIFRDTDGQIPNQRVVSIIRPYQRMIAETLAAVDSEKYTFVDLYALTFDAAASGTLLHTDREHLSQTGIRAAAEAVYHAVFDGICEKEGFGMTDIWVSDSGTPFGAGTAADPISSLTVAFSRAADEATLHVVGTLTFARKNSAYAASIFTPVGMKKLTIVGEGSGAVLALEGDVFKVGSDLKLDNLTLQSPSSGAALICSYRSVELTPTVTTSGKWGLIGGYAVSAQFSEADKYTQESFDTVESASCDRDVVLEINGGTFVYFMGTNRRYYETSPLGVYSGNLRLHIGSGATISAHARNGICGMNYLAGSIAANVESWQANSVLREYSVPGTLAAGAYNEAMNTGKIAITLADSLGDVTVILAGDLDKNGKLELKDTLLLLRSVLDNAYAADFGDYYWNCKEANLVNVIRSLKRLAK